MVGGNGLGVGNGEPVRCDTQQAAARGVKSFRNGDGRRGEQKACVRMVFQALMNRVILRNVGHMLVVE